MPLNFRNNLHFSRYLVQTQFDLLTIIFLEIRIASKNVSLVIESSTLNIIRRNQSGIGIGYVLQLPSIYLSLFNSYLLYLFHEFESC